MIQANQIGKYRKKISVLTAKQGKTFVTPKNKHYIFDFEKIGNKYFIIICYLGKRWRLTEREYNLIDTDEILESIEKHINELN